MGQISPKELNDFIEFSPPNIVNFLNESVKELDLKSNLGVINSEQNYIFQKEIRTDRIYDQLCYKFNSSSENKAISFKSSSLQIICLPGSIESMEFHEAINNCDND